MLTRVIAVIDDEADLVNLFSEALQLNGFKVCAFTNPLEALVQFEKDPVKYGLVICDFKMPVMDGNTLCTVLINHNPDLKVILMSACSDIKYNKEKFLFVNKPISIAQLIKLVRTHLPESYIKV